MMKINYFQYNFKFKFIPLAIIALVILLLTFAVYGKDNKAPGLPKININSTVTYEQASQLTKHNNGMIVGKNDPRLQMAYWVNWAYKSWQGDGCWRQTQLAKIENHSYFNQLKQAILLTWASDISQKQQAQQLYQQLLPITPVHLQPLIRLLAGQLTDQLAKKRICLFNKRFYGQKNCFVFASKSMDVVATQIALLEHENAMLRHKLDELARIESIMKSRDSESAS